MGTSVAQWATTVIVLLSMVVLPLAIVELEMYWLHTSLPATVFAVFAMLPALLLGAGSLLVMLGSR